MFRVLVNRFDVELRHFSEEISRGLFEVSHEVVAEVAETDDLSRRIYDSWFKFRENALSLSPYSTHGFMTSRDIYKNSVRD